MIFEINTWVWLTELGTTLGAVPDAVWDAVIPPGTDAVWLMGVWTRSLGGQPAGPDVVGSAYCIRDYHVDPRLGGDDGLAAARDALARRGLRFILDWVPNHVAPDHPWVAEHPDVFIDGTGPDDALRIGDRWVANGRDPYFPPWPDVVQLNVFRPELRSLAATELQRIAGQCDGVRCDMAMLVLDDVFARTWGERAGPPLPEPYWPAMITAAKSANPAFFLLAEAYWDLESALLQQGFDACYDKQLYDHFVALDAAEVRAHLGADGRDQARTVRFLENHDERRAAATWSPAAERACTAAIASVPGTLLVYEGQLDGRREQVPVQLGRRRDERPDHELRRFIEGVLALRPGMIAAGDWSMRETSGWPDNDSHQRLLAWSWGAEWLVVVNLADSPSQGLVRVPWPSGSVHLVDRVSGQEYERSGDELFVDLGPFASHLFERR